jgi:Protein of unknown function (DUF3618)
MAKSSAQLEREAEQTRSQLAATLDELRSRITPGQLLDQTLDFARESNAGEFVRNLGRDARDNPLPLALMGAGIAWLMMTNGRRRGFDAALTDATNSASGAIYDTKSRARGDAELVSSAESGAPEPASGISQDAAAAGGSFLAFCREHPLVLGGIGLALGALVGAALPSSESGDPHGAGASGETTPPDDDLAASQAVEDFRSVP